MIHGGVGIAHDLVGVAVLGAREGNADARGREHLTPADGKWRVQRGLDAERDGVGLFFLAELVQENRELVSAQPGQGVSLPEARLEATRHGREQLVSHQVAQTVVDDLEAIEVEVQHREPAAGGPCLDRVEAPPEAFHEDRAIAEPGQRVESSGAAKGIGPGWPRRRIGQVCQRACETRRAPARASRHDPAAQKQPVGAVLVANPVLVLKVGRLAREILRDRLLERSDVVRMDTVNPFLRMTDAVGRRQAEHRPPPAGGVELVAPQIPLPQPVAGAFRRERDPIFASLERLFGLGSLRDVIPQQRHAVGNGKHLDLKDPRTLR